MECAPSRGFSFSPHSWSIKKTAPRFQKHPASPKRFKYLPSQFNRSQSRSPKAVSNSPENKSDLKPSASPEFFPKLATQIYIYEPDSHYELDSKTMKSIHNEHNSWLSSKKMKDLELVASFKSIEKECKALKIKIKEDSQLDRKELCEIEANKQSHPLAGEFFKAVKSQDFLSVKTLVVMNPELIREVDTTLQTGLHWAVKRRDLKIVKFLLSYGGNGKIKDLSGRSPEMIARKNENFDILKAFTECERRSAVDFTQVIVDSNKKSEGFRRIVQLKSMMKRRRQNML